MRILRFLPARQPPDGLSSGGRRTATGLSCSAFRLPATAAAAVTMIQLERRLAERYPHWFRGRRARIARPLLRTLARWSRVDAIDAFLADSVDLRGFAFVEAALAFLQARYHSDDAERARIPARGRLLIVANHPSGVLDALALLDLVGSVRRDVKIVANDLLGAIGNLDCLLLPVRILGGRPGAESLRAVEAALDDEQCVIVFPAGEVSRLGPRGVRDTRGFVRFARTCHAPVLPVRIVARNSALFYGASVLFKPAGTALLAREMFARHARPIAMRVGHPQTIAADTGTQAALSSVRRALYALGTKREVAMPAMAPLVAAVDPVRVRADVQQLAPLGMTGDGKRIGIGRLAVDSALLREIGRLRELTFRAVGEGTGRALDLDAYDSWYEHIVLWDDAQSRVAGACRVARGAPVLAAHGLKGLDPDFRDSIDGLIEIDLQRMQPKKRKRYLEAGATGVPAE